MNSLPIPPAPAPASSAPLRLHADVVVVGARLAGAAAAMLLARRGLRVVVLERGTFGSDTLSTHAFMKTGVIQLHRWGLLDRVVASGAPALRRTTIHYGDDAVTVPMKPGGAVDALYAPRRTVLDAILVTAAREAGADVRFGVTVTGVRRDGHGRVMGISGRNADGRSLEVSAPMTIGADGIRSVVARAVDAPTYRSAGPGAASAFVYGHFAGVSSDGYDFHYRPGVSAGVIPTNDGAGCVWIGVPASRFGQEIRADVTAGFWRTLAIAAPELVEGLRRTERLGPWRSFPGQRGYVRHSFGPGWALVGDAAHFKDPIGAHGMTDALRDAELLARAVHAVLGDGADEHGALAAYQHQRDALSTRFFAAVERIASYRWDLQQLPALMIELSKAMGDEADAMLALDTDAGVAA